MPTPRRTCGVDAQALADICTGRSQISADLAIRLERAFGSTADTWLRMQAAYDLARARETAEANELTEIEALRLSTGYWG